MCDARRRAEFESTNDITITILDIIHRQSQSHITTDRQSVIMSRYRAHSGTCDFLPEGCFLKFAVLSYWGALSDERSVCHLDNVQNCDSLYIYIYIYIYIIVTNL
jgi:hypothetical protein